MNERVRKTLDFALWFCFFFTKICLYTHIYQQIFLVNNLNSNLLTELFLTVKFVNNIVLLTSLCLSTHVFSLSYF